MVTAAGLVVIGLTEGSGGPGSGASLAALIGIEGRRRRAQRAPRGGLSEAAEAPSRGLVLGVAAGTLFGVSDISVKYLTHAAHGGVGTGLLNGWIVSALAASVVAFYASARSLQLGPTFEVIGFTSIAVNLIAISGGILVFHDPVGHGALQSSGGCSLLSCDRWRRTDAIARQVRGHDHFREPASCPNPCLIRRSRRALNARHQTVRCRTRCGWPWRLIVAGYRWTLDTRG